MYVSLIFGDSAGDHESQVTTRSYACLPYLFRMLNLSVDIICVVVLHCFVYFTYGISFYYVGIIAVSFTVLLVNKSLRTHSRAFAKHKLYTRASSL